MSAIKQHHSTNYFNTFISAAEDTRATVGTEPATKGGKQTIAGLQYDLISRHPYQYTSDDVLFQVYAERNDLTKGRYKTERTAFFSKGQPCLRASPLTKTYGFGIHCNENGRIALYGMETEAYQELMADPSLQQLKAMRNARK